jgi:hypothetical protein
MTVKTKLTDFILTGLLLMFLGLQNCGYEERGHSNTPAENPGSQTRVGVDSTVHPGNIERDTIKTDR